jgi:hypothetical protein
VVNEALRKMREAEDYRDYVREKMAEAEADLANGEVFDFEEVMNQLDAQAKDYWEKRSQDKRA